MKERPILFSGPMVRAILDGRKTQTRRVVKPQPSSGWKLICPGLGDHKPVLGQIISKHPKRGRFGVFTAKQHDGWTERDLIVCPYGKPGDRLWVRESWSVNFYGGYSGGSSIYEHYGVEYRAGGDTKEIENNYRCENLSRLYNTQRGAWRSSIHMPRWASRILLEIVSVRVERLNEISEEDASSEGCSLECMSPIGNDNGSYIWGEYGFYKLWESINGSGSWQENPWVWVVEFKVVEPKTLSSECQKVVESVRLLAAHNHPSMFLILVQSRTGMNTDYIHNRLKDWVMERHMPSEGRNCLEEILLAALDVQSEAIHGIDWESLCGVDYKHQVKLLMGEM